MRLAKYNQEKTINFSLFQVDGIDIESAATFAAGDIKIMKDEGVEANTTNLPTDEGQGYSLVLTATELSAARIVLYIVDQTATKVWLDTNIEIETYGNASAEHAFDLDTASTAQTADHAANISAILTDTGTTLDTKLDDIQGATFSSATDSLEAIRDRGDAAWTTGAGGTPPQLLQSTTIATLASQTSFTLTAGSADNDAYNGAIAVVTDSATSEQKAVGEVLDYVGSTKTITLSADPGIFTMAVGDTVEIIAALGAAGSGATAADVWSYATRVLTAGTNLNDIAATDIVSNGAITTLTGAVVNVDTVDTTTTNTDMRGTDSAATATALATAQSDLDLITGTDGATLATTQANYAPSKAGDSMDLITNALDAAALATDAVTEIQSGLATSTNVSDLLTTQLTEGYAADGVAPTLTQALMLIQQMLGDFSIVGTTLTVKELDGLTTAATFTLGDGTSPTSLTRAS